MATDLQTILSWFKTGLKPTQAQFWASWSSFWHKDEAIPQSSVSGLTNVLNAKVENDQFNAYKAANDALILGKEDKTKKGAPNGYAPLDEFTKLAAQYLNIVNDLVTGGSTALLSAEQGKVLQTQISAINTLLTSDNVNLDTVQELVDAIETVQLSLSTILVNDLTTGGTTKALTAEMGKSLKTLVDSLAINKLEKGAYAGNAQDLKNSIVALEGKFDNVVNEIGEFISGIDSLTDLTVIAPNTSYSYDYGTLSVVKNTGLFSADEFVYSKYGSSCFEIFDLEVRAVCKVAGLGLAPLLKSSQNNFKFSWTGRITATGMTISSTSGNGTTWSDRVSNTNVVAINVNDLVSYKLSRNKNKIIFTVLNISTGDTSSISFTSSYNEVTNCQPTMFMYGFLVIGGSWDVVSFKANTQTIKNIDNLFIGDSITQGFSSSSSSTVLNNSSGRFYDLFNNVVFSKLRNVNMSAGGSAPYDFSGTINEIRLINPKNVYIMLGTNSQNQTEYLTFTNALNIEGYNLIIQTIPPTLGSFNSWLKTTFPKILDTCAPLFTGSNSSGSTWNAASQGFSGHPSLQGHQQMASVILDSLKNTKLKAPFISADTISNSAISLSWPQIQNNAGYTLEVSTDGVSFSVLANLSVGVNSFNHVGLTSGQGYYYRILTKSTGDFLNSDYSLIASYKAENTIILGNYEKATTGFTAMNRMLPSGVDGWFKMTVGDYNINQVDRVVLGFRRDNAVTGDNSVLHQYIFWYLLDNKIKTSSLATDVALPTITYKTMQWVRLRRTSGIVYYEYSDNNIDWIVLASMAETNTIYAQLYFVVPSTKIRAVSVSSSFVVV